LHALAAFVLAIESCREKQQATVRARYATPHKQSVELVDPKARTLQEGRKMKREPALYQC